jgi:hypothetical protein
MPMSGASLTVTPTFAVGELLNPSSACSTKEAAPA